MSKTHEPVERYCDGVAYKDIARALRHLREESGRTQKQVGDYLSCGAYKVGAFENRYLLDERKIPALPGFFGYKKLQQMVDAAHALPETTLAQRGNALRILRNHKMLTQTELAREAGYGVHQIQRLEKGYGDIPDCRALLVFFDCEFWSQMVEKAMEKSLEEATMCIKSGPLNVMAQAYIYVMDPTPKDKQTALRGVKKLIDSRSSVPVLELRAKIAELQKTDTTANRLFAEALQYAVDVR